MGCDIHTVIERKVGNKWIAESVNAGEIRCRDYYVFESMAQVRGKNGEPQKGFPEDASDTAIMLNKDGEGDWHSHSFLSINEAIRFYIRGRKRNPYSNFEENSCSWLTWTVFHVEDECPPNNPERRIVFWFDN